MLLKQIDQGLNIAVEIIPDNFSFLTYLLIL